jgi:glycosyltransferase involved in cell wall biosynthesis
VNVLHVCTSDSWGGLELYAGSLIKELKASGCDAIVVCKPNSPLEKFLLQNDIRCEHFPNNAKVSFASIRFLKHLLPNENIGVVHVHFHNDIWNASLSLRGDSNRKLFLSIYMGVTKKMDPLHWFIYKRVDAFFSSSEYLNSVLPQRYPVAKEKVHLLSYGRRLELYTLNQSRRHAIRQQLQMTNDQLLVGTMVRIDPGKGVMDFAESFLYLDDKMKSNVKYIIVGEPTRRGRVRAGESPYEPQCVEYFNEVKKFVQKNNLEEKILFVGYQEDTVGYLSAMDVFVFPSRDELYSLVMLDAMCLGLPIVAARAGGNVVQVQENVRGMLYNVADSRDLAEKIMRYLNNPPLRIQHGEEARKFVKRHHDMKNTIERLLKFYRGQNA